MVGKHFKNFNQCHRNLRSGPAKILHSDKKFFVFGPILTKFGQDQTENKFFFISMQNFGGTPSKIVSISVVIFKYIPTLKAGSCANDFQTESVLALNTLSKRLKFPFQFLI